MAGKALEYIRLGLPAASRGAVQVKGGVIDRVALNQLHSSDANTQAQQSLVNSDKIINVTTGSTFVNDKGETVSFKYTSPEQAAAQEAASGMVVLRADGQGPKGVNLTGYTDTDQKSGNINVAVSDGTGEAKGLPVQEGAVTMGHELYIHAADAVNGKPTAHVPSVVRDVETRTRENTKQ